MLNRDFGISIIYITHDLTTAYQICDNIVVLYLGNVAEVGAVERVIRTPKHPYTQLLVSSIPVADRRRRWGEDAPAEAEASRRPPAASVGCPFAPRCPAVMDICCAESATAVRARRASRGGVLPVPRGAGAGDGRRSQHLGERSRMKVLLVGGAGLVGTFITPYLQQQHSLRVLDLRPPQHDVEYVQGSITNPEALRRALDGVDTFINMVMKSPQGGSSSEQTLTQIVENYEVNTLGLHLLLWTAQGMGVKRGCPHQHDERPLPRAGVVSGGGGRCRWTRPACTASPRVSASGSASISRAGST